MTMKLASVFRKLSFIVPNKFVTKSGIKGVNETLSVCEFYTDDESVNVYVKDWSADEDFFADKTLISSDRAIDLLAANPSYWLDETYL